MRSKQGRIVLIGTHHKTGTVWMRELFSRIAETRGIPFLRLAAHQSIDFAPLRRDHPVAILFQDHSFFADLPLAPQDRGLHVVRDPRDLLVSGANYHGWANEAWLHRMREDFGNRSYQEVIRALPFADAVRFEMRHSAGRAIRDMLGFDRRGTFADCRYEDLMIDADGAASRRLFEQLGFLGEELEVCLEIFEASRLKRDDGAGLELRRHVQNPDPYQWRYLYDVDLLASFRERCGDAAERLGYLPSDPELLVDDEPRRQSYLARFMGNRDRLDEALALVEASLARSPDHPHLLRTRDSLAAAAAAAR